MEDHWIYVKTAKGEAVVHKRTRLAHRDLRAVLIQVDGVIDVAALKRQVGEGHLVEASLAELERLQLVERQWEQGAVPAPLVAPQPVPPARHREPRGEGWWPRWRGRLAAWQRRRQALRDEQAFLRAYEANSAEDPFAPVKLKPIRRGARVRGGWLRRGLIGLALLLLISALSVLVFPYDRYRQATERRLAKALGQTVSIGSMGFSLQPYPNITLSDLVIGDGCRLKTLRAIPAPFSLLGEDWEIWYAQFEDLDLRRQGIVASALWFAAPAQGRPAILLRRASLDRLSVDVDGARVEALSGEMDLSASGALTRIVLHDAAHGLRLEATPGNAGYRLLISGNAARLPLLPELNFDDLEVRGEIDERALRLSSINARLYGGGVLATATVDWSAGAVLRADATLSQVSLSKLLTKPAVAAEISGRLHFEAAAERVLALPENLRYEGLFEIGRGQIDGYDLLEVLRSSRPTRGGYTRFERLSGSLRRDGNGLHFAALRLDAGALQASGGVDIDRRDRLQGRLDLALTGPAVRVRAVAAVDGELADPQLSLLRSERSARR